ncbi:membrane-bound PQQ-dependent dehydrogenase, glucose/quinate/shikimate family [Sphingomonas oleivorans]|uniref:Membrane-bound PQQ-dependent dehydrogenase, glucose/quinate/shikimate family n=1 Tax=Sphingomonas oleivorans TaxID=1735121 RepID=A0A2T5FVF1_9SPHN|nr:membrane-bound PQQ-dependent dehydrogenase, glucose/quinate/shikimate family [Sphingomonas oleivorans]PTQ09421.1 membrane-bound PQQ-dependent dehydrogenase, glucose/quinate/shikimate family [Sphingomonas oleivorans]
MATAISQPIAVRVTAVILLLIGLWLVAGGIWLAALGGSIYYLLAGLGYGVTGLLLYRGRTAALWLYALLLAATLAWALWEVGLDWWALIPRGVIPTLIGLWLLLPWVSRSLDGGVSVRHAPFAALLAAVALVAIAAIASIARDRFDIAGRVPAPSAPADATALRGAAANDWLAYGGTALGQRYSTLADIRPENAGRLKLVWTYNSGDLQRPTDPRETTFEVTPLKIGDTLYLCSPHAHAIALDATTGKEKWRFDPRVSASQANEHLTCRGLSYHDAAPGAVRAPAAAIPFCSRRLFLPTVDARLIALDAATGRPCPGFGRNGTVDLSANMPNMRPGFYMATSPPVVTRNLAIIGGAINDNVRTANPSGVIRAYDVTTGRLVWNWDPGNPDATAPIAAGAKYSAGAPNAWSVMSADEALGLVYAPLGNQSPDQWGGRRSPEVDRFSSSIVALDIATGRLRWVVQTVHHDLWDRDVPSQPTLVDLTIGGARVPALIGPTKQGDIFVLDRRTGRPIFPVREVPVGGSAGEGDRASPTQPVSAFSYMPSPLREADMWGATPFDQLACRISYRRLRYHGPYTPPSVQGSLVYPGNTGVFNWGGIAVDPVRQIMIGTPVRLAFVQTLIPRATTDAREVTKATTSTMGADVAAFGENYGAPFAVRLVPFLSLIGLPCQAPPWGSIVAADLRTGRTLWRHRNGTARDQTPIVPIPLNLGTPSLGGPLVTAGGVAFYSGTLDYYLRAYDVATGRKLWQARLPAGGQATPMTYRAADGRQMVVVAAGGHGTFGTKHGDAVLAFALEP